MLISAVGQVSGGSRGAGGGPGGGPPVSHRLDEPDCNRPGAPHPDMVIVERQALVAYSAASMYALVEDVESYPRFLPWCSRVEVALRDSVLTVATLHIDYHGVRQQLTTENRTRPGERIELALVRGPFHSLRGEWRFAALGAEACRVELSLAYQLASPILDRLLGPVFNHIADTFVDAFVRRADALHAGGSR
jgi:ribosome-associated toxin RatA of RatAB toxin-antitoxin module